MTWWCSASGVSWVWAWKPYPGVWIALLLLIVPYLRRMRGSPEALQHTVAGRWAPVSFLAGVAALWAATDWPIGALGAGYLLSAHTVSYILLVLVAPPFILMAIPSPRDGSRLARLARLFARPIPALVTYHVILLVSHVPIVTDSLMRLQLGSFAIDLAWFCSGMALWWPIVAPAHGLSSLSHPLRMGYLFLATIVPTIPAAFWTFADFPIYSLYELAPRATTLSAGDDQQLAGLIMKVIGDIPLWFGFGVMFFAWDRSEPSLSPNHPSVTALRD